MNISPKTTKMNISPIFCRFCASSKPSGELRDLSTHMDTLEDVKRIIRLLGINFVQMSDDVLPKAICDVCYRNLKTCCQVFEIARNSQKVLSKMFSENEGRQKNENLFDFNSLSMLEKEKEVAQILIELSLGTQHQQHNTGTSQQPKHEAVEQQPQPVEIPEQPPKPAGVQQQPLEPAGVSQQPLEPAGIPQEANKPGSSPQLDHKAGIRIKIRKPTWAAYPKICEQCGVSSTTILGLLEHRRSAHGLSGFQCVDCSIMVPTFFAFISHVQAHRPELIDYCPICDLKTDDLMHILSHSEALVDHTINDLSKTDGVKRKKTDIRDNDYCPICHLKTDDRIHILSHSEALVDHSLTYLPKTDGVKRKNTDIRDKCFSGSKVRREINCRSDSPWECFICKKLFQDQSVLKSHITEQHN